MKMNNSGKALTIFLVIIAVLLVCLTGISAFFFLKEIDLRRSVELSLEQSKVVQAKLEGELKEAQQQAYLLEEKYKEAKENLENLQDDLELAQGVKQKMQEENKSLAANLEKLQTEKESLNTQLSKAREEVDSLQADLDAAQLENKSLEDQVQAAAAEKSPPAEAATETPAADLPTESVPPDAAVEPAAGNELSQDKVDLEKIIVAPGTDRQGKVISVDSETGFLIASLGSKQGIEKGVILSVYRNETYLGDVQVSRVLPEMSAADFIPPLSGQQVNKDDLVTIKQ